MNASIMIRIHDSFVTRLINEVPVLILFKCICHSSALIASKSCSKVSESCECMLHAITTYISNSPKRSVILCEYQTFFYIESRKILKLSGTRWPSYRSVLQEFSRIEKSSNITSTWKYLNQKINLLK